MDFKCIKNITHKFSIPKPDLPKEVINGQEVESPWKWKGVVHCPYCGTDDIMEDISHIPVSTGKRDLEKMRRENRERTADAKRLANRAESERRQYDPDVIIAPPPGPKSRFGTSPMPVRKSVLDSLQDKSPVQDN